ncbi:MAG TPA: hypothetical protein VII49_06790 [Rhizomicrobium sp.]
MVLRALFWITLVSVLMPREPDLGFGRPGIQGLPSEAVSRAGQICRGREAPCTAGSSFLESVQGSAFRTLVQVKADIEAQQRVRAARRGGSS